MAVNDIDAPAQTPPVPPVGRGDRARKKPAFDDVMLAMDIVDTLRHQALVVERELGAEAREEALLDRLREIYRNQGITVSDDILRDGVKALEEKRFVYEPTDRGFQGRLAGLYVSRTRWLKPLAFVLGVATFLTGVYEFGIDAPRERRVEALRVERTVTLPRRLVETRDAALAIAETDDARRRIETAYQNGVAAAADGDLDAARAAAGALDDFREDLSRDLDIRVVSRPGEYSGVFRIPNDTPDARNYYLIVEAVDAGGRVHALEIASEEDRATKRAPAWGVRVPKGVFDAIAADKQDDQIIQKAVVGRKPKGWLAPRYDVATAGGAILEW
ncbi:MAG: DUF6384 family protein [Pseudomonadota bacterium]